MIYVKTFLLVSGLWAFAIAPLPLPVVQGAVVWSVLLLVLRIVLIRTVGRATTDSIFRFAVLAAVIWTVGAVLMAWVQALDGSAIASYAIEVGLLRAIRFACALSWSVLLMAWIRPEEIYLIPWLPKAVCAFIIVFRVFVARSIVLVSDILDGLHAIGLPHGVAVIKSLLSVSVPFPTHGLWKERRAARLALMTSAYLGLLLAYLDLLLAEEMPEVDAAFRSLSED